MPPILSRYALAISRFASHGCAPLTHPQPGEAFASMRLAASKHALRFLPFRVVSDAVFGLYMLHWIRCFERTMGL